MTKRFCVGICFPYATEKIVDLCGLVQLVMLVLNQGVLVMWITSSDNQMFPSYIFVKSNKDQRIVNTCTTFSYVRHLHFVKQYIIMNQYGILGNVMVLR